MILYYACSIWYRRHTSQRPTIEAKETYYRAKRDLLWYRRHTSPGTRLRYIYIMLCSVTLYYARRTWHRSHTCPGARLRYTYIYYLMLSYVFILCFCPMFLSYVFILCFYPKFLSYVFVLFYGMHAAFDTVCIHALELVAIRPRRLSCVCVRRCMWNTIQFYSISSNIIY